MLKSNDVSVDTHDIKTKSVPEQLAEAHSEIEELKLHIAWLERSFE